MDSIGDLIYVIAIVGWIIYSFVSKSNKQKNSRKTVDETTSRPDAQPDLKKMLEEMLGKTEAKKPEPAPVYETRKPTIQPVYNEQQEGQSLEGKALNPVEDYKFGDYKTYESVEGKSMNSDDYKFSGYKTYESLEGKSMNIADYKFGNYKTWESISEDDIAIASAAAPHSIAEKEGRKEAPHSQEEKEQNRFKDFDIEKAIIYSEILKRPKWAV